MGCYGSPQFHGSFRTLIWLWQWFLNRRFLGRSFLKSMCEPLPFPAADGLYFFDWICSLSFISGSVREFYNSAHVREILQLLSSSTRHLFSRKCIPNLEKKCLVMWRVKSNFCNNHGHPWKPLQGSSKPKFSLIEWTKEFREFFFFDQRTWKLALQSEGRTAWLETGLHYRMKVDSHGLQRACVAEWRLMTMAETLLSFAFLSSKFLAGRCLTCLYERRFRVHEMSHWNPPPCCTEYESRTRACIKGGMY